VSVISTLTVLKLNTYITNYASISTQAILIQYGYIVRAFSSSQYMACKML
jgi:hypothetical protein